MNINATLIAQAIMFGLFVWFCMRFVWPPITAALAARQKQIADGLASSERGRNELELATKRASTILHEAKQQAADLVAQAEKRGVAIIEEAKEQARVEGDRIIVGAKAEIEQEVSRAKEQLRDQVAHLAVAGAEQILRREVDAKAHADMLASLKGGL
ncbi:F0F1 ATP synthase subunit B [Rhodocyclus purpureus]|uniref:F0F1 ATP synthase subunit B n=1 Tax=Rhodocyclus purpureus TaxID=1067 RepID=UPI001913FB42|nr:F0F1 ATP synthase subunit B [Rhodocyclus purpureus]MBK5914157.1 F0F1 ATP synthase subunit B [Rhodocyclus purpureus]